MPDHPQMSELADEHGMDLHYGRKEKPAEHVHEWHLIDPDDRDVITAECFWGWEESGYKIQCPATLDEKEINRRLNAYDKLIAERDLLLRGLGINDPSRIAEILPASALEK